MLILMQQPKTSLNEIVGANVKRRRQALGWSQADLAERLAAELGKTKIDPTTITRMEAGTRPTTVAELEALEGAFGVSFKEFIATEADEQLDRLRDAVLDVRRAEGDFARARRERLLARQFLQEVIAEVKALDYPSERRGDVATMVGLAMNTLGNDPAP